MSNRGKPLRATNDDNRCQALTVMPEWKREHGKDERCPFMAKWSVDKNRLCSHHARMEAVALAIEKGYMTRLIFPAMFPQIGQHPRLMTMKEPK